MKKFLLIGMALLAVGGTYAHESLKGTKIMNNWYVGATGGMATKTTHNTWMQNLNGNASVRVGRDVFPAFGVMAEVTTYFGDLKFSHCNDFVKAVNGHLLFNVNFTNWIHGIPTQPRLVEVSGLLGPGFNHVNGYDGIDQKNDFVAKFACNVAFNVGKKHAWQVFVEPAMNWNLNRYSKHVTFDADYSAVQVSAGFYYRFRNADGTHRFSRSGKKRPDPVFVAEAKTQKSKPETKETKTKKEGDKSSSTITPIVIVEPAEGVEKREVVYVLPNGQQRKVAEGEVWAQNTQKTSGKLTREEVMERYAKKSQAEKKTAKTVEKQQKTVTTQTKQQKAVNTQPKQQTAVKKTMKSETQQKPVVSQSKAVIVKPTAGEKSDDGLPVVLYSAESTIVDASQTSKLVQVVNYLRTHPRAVVTIKGSQQRIANVRDMLVRRYAVNSSRLTLAPIASASAVSFGVK